MAEIQKSFIDDQTKDLLDSLKEVYNRKNKQDFFCEEESIFKEIIPKLIDALKPFNFKIISAIGLGSTATVWKVKDSRLNQFRALKLARPRIGKLYKITSVIWAEAKMLAELTHQNIIKIYFAEEIKISIDGEEYLIPFFIMEYFEDLKDLDEYVQDNLASLNSDDILSHLRYIALGIDFLHKKKIIHCDIKPGNIIITPEAPALIADLGYAKTFKEGSNKNNEETLTLTFTPDYAHPKLKKNIKRSSDSAANITEIKRSELQEAFDLFSFGRTIQKILRIIREKEQSLNFNKSIFTPYQWRYLALIAVRLLDGQVEKIYEDALESDLILGLPQSIMYELKYNSINEALEDLEKLLHLYDLEGEIPELNPNLSSYIQIPGSRVPFSKRISRIINHPFFLRLIQVSQLGFVSLLFPGATHTRFEHSLGTFEKCCEIIRALWYDEINCLFRSIMRKSDIEALLLASILHDLGHYPMAHDLTEADNLFSHDHFTKCLIETLDTKSGETIADIIQKEWDIEPDEAYSINKKADKIIAILDADKNSGIRERILKSIISGPLDADKLDYLYRDSLHAGVNFGINIDIGRLLSNLTICIKMEDNILKIAELGVTEKALAVAESIWRARREMFRQMYWHHTVRSLKSMLIYVIRRIIINFKTDTVKKDFVHNLYDFCISPLSFCQNQANLGIFKEINDKKLKNKTTYNLGLDDDDDDENYIFSNLSYSDDAVISFLWPNTDDFGRNILQMIRYRKLYKRVAVLSFEKEKDLFRSVYGRFREERLARHLQEQENRREWLENAILSECSKEVQDIAKEKKEIDKIPIILVDVPLKALHTQSKKETLWYISEDQLGMEFDKLFSVYSISETGIQLEQTEFDKAVGKIRVFAHPACEKQIKKCINSKKIIELLSESLNANIS